jgi:pimeloyl-ACP methyl ester carboxylesterase
MMPTASRKLGNSLNAFSAHDDAASKRPANKWAIDRLHRDLKKFDVPTLVLHGEDDQLVPVKDSAVKSARLIKGAKDIYYPGAPHGITATHQDQVNADLLAFIKA